MIGGPDEAVERLDPIFATIAPGVDVGRAHARAASGDPSTGRERLPALRPERRRPLREDGPQRDRVRGDGRLRRGPQHPQERRRRQARARGRRRDRAAHRPRVLPVRARHPRGRRGLAPRQRDRLLAARPDRGGAAASRRTSTDFEGRVSDSGEGRWTSIAAIEEGVPAPVLTRRALLALRLARPRRLRRQGAVGDAQAVRRPRREEVGEASGVTEEVLADAEAAARARRRADRRGGGGGDRRPRARSRSRSAAATRRGGCSSCSASTSSTGTRIDLFQVDERVAPDGDPDRNLTHLLASLPAAGARAACGRCRSTTSDLDAAAARYAERAARRRSTSSTSASAPTATPPRSSPATRCSRSPTGWSR